MEINASPTDRNQIDVYVQEFETWHKPGADGTLVAVDRVYIGKKGTSNYQRLVEVPRLKRDDPRLFAMIEPIYERWKKTNEIATEGTPLEAWPVITKPQIKLCKDLGLRSVEDVAGATDSTREKLKMGGLDLIRNARAFLANLDKAAATNRVADLEVQLEQARKDIAEQRAMIDAMMAEKGKKPQKPMLAKDAA